MNRRFATLLFVLLLVGAGWPASVASAQPNGGDQNSATVPPEQTSPRAVLLAFYERMARDDRKAAAQLLDLSGRIPETVAAKGPDLAYMLHTIMQRLVELPTGEQWPPGDPILAGAPADADFEGAWSLAELECFARPETSPVRIVRDGDGWWRFSSETVLAIEGLFELTETLQGTLPEASQADAPVPFPVWYRSLFPEQLRQQHLLMPTYQWLSLLVIFVAGLLGDRVTRKVLTRAGDAILPRVDPDFSDTTAGVWRPVGRLANAAIWYAGAYFIGLPLELIGVLLMVLKVITIIAAVWAALAVINLIAGYLTRRAKRTARKFDDLIVPVAATTTKVLAVLIGLLLATAAFSGELPSTLLGGLGIGGVAIALASQETLSNFFGSIAVLFDRPFEVGDWVIIDSLEGEVESVGFRSTRLRTSLNSQVTVPNSKVAAAAIDNWGRRRYRRYRTRLGLEYSTPTDRIEAFCEGVRELIRRQPHTRKDFYAAYFNDFGASALEVLVVCYFETPDWPTELRERHRLLADIARLAERLEIGFAFPTQTVHLHQAGEQSQPKPLSEAEREGQTLAADIAGELLNYQDRPGKVKFTGPTEVDREKRD